MRFFLKNCKHSPASIVNVHLLKQTFIFLAEVITRIGKMRRLRRRKLKMPMVAVKGKEMSWKQRFCQSQVPVCWLAGAV